MSRGPPPTPTAVLKMRGSWRGDTREDEPQPEGGISECPDWLDTDARAEWDRVKALLDGSQIGSRIDSDALTLYCVAFSRWKKTEKLIAERGIEDQKDLLRVANTAMAQCHKLLAEFGMTPASRTRVKAEKKEKPKGIAGMSINCA